jgi:hypothetical protein
MDNAQIAELAEYYGRRAFWGLEPSVMRKVSNLMGYQMDGTWHPANELSLQEVIIGVALLWGSTFSKGVSHG